MPLADGSSAGTAQPELPEPAAQQGGRQRAEPDWFVGGRNGEDGFASCAPGRSFAASKASLMGSSSSQGSRSAWYLCLHRAFTCEIVALRVPV